MNIQNPSSMAKMPAAVISSYKTHGQENTGQCTHVSKSMRERSALRSCRDCTSSHNTSEGFLHSLPRLDLGSGCATILEALYAVKTRLHDLEHTIDIALKSQHCHDFDHHVSSLQPTTCCHRCSTQVSGEAAEAKKDRWITDASLASNLTVQEQVSIQTVASGFFDQSILSLNTSSTSNARPAIATRATGESDVDDVTSEIRSMEDFFDFDDATLQLGLLPADSNLLMSPHLDLDLSVNTPGTIRQGSDDTLRQRTSANTGPIRRNFQCSHCMKSFSRPSDRDRHARSHNPNAHRHSCPAIGCDRVGNKGFLRKDKLAQHREHMRH